MRLFLKFLVAFILLFVYLNWISLLWVGRRCAFSVFFWNLWRMQMFLNFGFFSLIKMCTFSLNFCAHEKFLSNYSFLKKIVSAFDTFKKFKFFSDSLSSQWIVLHGIEIVLHFERLTFVIYDMLPIQVNLKNSFSDSSDNFHSECQTRDGLKCTVDLVSWWDWVECRCFVRVEFY